jgi:FAD:protein FMN transferase
MGTEARIVLYAASPETAQRAAAAAFARIAELDGSLSDYKSDSELARLVARAGTGPIEVSRDLLTVLQESLRISQETNGAFDVTVGPLVALWRRARKSGALPDASELKAAAVRVGYRHVVLDTIAGTVWLELSGMRLDFGGIAKGYAVDEALRTLREHEVKRALIEFGGEIGAAGPPPHAPAWRIAAFGSGPGAQTILLVDSVASTSGPTEQFLEVDGQHYSHVIDPRTHFGLRHRLVATVIAARGITADAYSTAITVLDSAQRSAFIAAHPNARFILQKAR